MGGAPFTPFSTVQTLPALSQTNIRPSGANVRPTASFQVPPMDSSTKPAGRTAAREGQGLRSATRNAAKRKPAPLKHRVTNLLIFIGSDVRKQKFRRGTLLREKHEAECEH